MKRFYRSRNNRIVAGVCGGVAEYFQIDPLLTRILWMASVVIGMAGLSIYCVAWAIVPVECREGESDKEHKSALLGLGVALIVIGLLGVAESQWLLTGWSLFRVAGMIPALMLTASGLVLMAVSLLSREPRPEPLGGDILEQPEAPAAPRSERRLCRSLRHRQLFGVCGGIADYFNIDPVLVRLIFLSGLFVSGGMVLLLYLILIFIIPEESGTKAPHGNF